MPCQAAVTISVPLYNELWSDHLTKDTEQMQEFTHGGPRAGTASPMTLHDFTSGHVSFSTKNETSQRGTDFTAHALFLYCGKSLIKLAVISISWLRVCIKSVFIVWRTILQILISDQMLFIWKTTNTNSINKVSEHHMKIKCQADKK